MGTMRPLGDGPDLDPLYESEAEKMIHMQSIRIISIRLGVPVDEVAGIYESVLAGLKKEAKVKDYLAVLVSKNVASLINKSHLGSPKSG